MTVKIVPDALKILWGKNFFNDRKATSIIRKEIAKFGLHPTPQNLHAALTRARYLKSCGPKKSGLYIQKYASNKPCLNEEILPGRLRTVLKKYFEYEIKDLELNFGRSGTCTAFLLRKILEKLIFLTFAKNSLSDKLKNKESGDFISLATMLNLATNHNIHGKPFLTPKTARAIAGIKFLGDTSAHNFLVNVEMETIIPQLPFIITAYDELAKKL
ncbi:MAG: hypothetical protein PHI59_06860 [Candidatus Omnitrophica bacterium]|nr:hypothetical protein [Candidatus Omnitrophota bacterium]